MRRLEFWELAVCGAGAGGAGVWGLAEAARNGWLRAVLDLFPRSSWERITWGLIPALLLLPLIAQGAVVAAASSARPAPVGRGIAGSVAGSLLALFVAGAAVLAGARHLPASAVGGLARALPVPLVLGGGALFVAGGLIVAGGVLENTRLRRAAVPVALLLAAAAWTLAYPWVVAASAVLDRTEAVVSFAAVVVGGAGGAAWSVRGATGH